METPRAFPPGFLWGTASSAHQVEGYQFNNQWTRFEQQPGAIADGTTSGAACDWWSIAEADFDRMQGLGLNAHRLSIEWSRVEPVPGIFDRDALHRYRSMLIALRERGITPWLCLHHFTNPLWVEDDGGWENPIIVARFTAYARAVAHHLGDLCDTWLTLNEPLVYLGQGWIRGAWPPHRQHPLLARRVFRHLLDAHAAAYHAIKELFPSAQVSMAKAIRRFGPARQGHPADQAAAWLRRYLYEDLWFAATVQGRLLSPLGFGQTVAHLGHTLDFIGINYYARQQIRFSPDPRRVFGREEHALGAELSDAGGRGPYSQLDPDGLAAAVRYAARFGKPIYVTENGLPDADDDQRPRWLLAYLAALQTEIAAGADVRGYFHWTLVDNFEWNEGWSLRFGLIALDPHTQTRTPRPSAALYSAIARANALPPRQPAAHGIPNAAE